MLMPSILLQKQERPSEAAPVFISRIPSRSYPETIPKEWRRKSWGNGKARPMLSQIDNLCSGTHPLVEAEGGVALVLGLKAGERDGGPSPTL